MARVSRSSTSLGLVGDVVDLPELLEQRLELPLLLVLALEVLAAEPLDRVGDLRARDLRHVLALEDPVAVLVDDLALLVHHVVVLEDALADQEVLLLDLLLGVLDLLREHLVLDRQLVAVVVRLREELVVEDAVDPVAGEQAHEVVLGREVEARLARVALAAGAAAQLVVDPARLVALGAADEEPAGLHDLLAVLLDLRLHLREDLVPGRCPSPALSGSMPRLTSSRWVRCSSLPPSLMSTPRPAMLVAIVTAPGLARLGDGLALALGVLGLGVQDRVLDAALLELLGEQLRDLDRDRAHEHRLARRVARLDLVGHGGPLAVLGLVDLVVAGPRGPSAGWWAPPPPGARRSS